MIDEGNPNNVATFPVMTTYTFGQKFSGITYGRDDLNLKEFEDCIFEDCDFGACNCLGVTFISCTFRGCRFDGAQLNHTAYRTVFFENCTLRNVNFAMSDKLIFEVHFTECVLDFAQFYGLRMNAATFTACSLVSVDFMACDLHSVLFDRCDLYRAEFEKADARRCDFSSSRNYTLHPGQTKVNRAIFSREGLRGLVKAFGVEVVE